MLAMLATTKKKNKGVPGTIQGIWEAQKIITGANADNNYANCGWDFAGGFLYVGNGTIKPSSAYVYTNNNYQYDMSTLAIKALRTSNRYSLQPDITVYNGKLYLTGGVFQSPSTNSYLNITGITDNTIVQDAAFNYSYKNLRVFILNGVMHILGGTVSSGGVTRGCYTFDLATSTLTNRGNAFTAGYVNAPGHGVMYNGKFYFSTGQSGANNIMYVYDPTTYKATALAQNPNSLQGESLVIIGDNIYTRSANNQIAVYNIPTNVWSYIDAPGGPAQISNANTVWFFYNNSIWYKYLDSLDTTVRRFWRLY